MKPECPIFQGFGGNITNTYKASGLLGHTAIDNSCGYGSQIHAYWGNEYVYKVLTVENPSNDGTGFTGVFTIVDDERGCFEFLYGHCNPSVKVGQILALGEVLGTEANNGEVYAGGMRISLAMQKSGDKRGSHRHDQKRPVDKVKDWNSTDHFLSQGSASYFKDGFYYKIVNYKNGYNGCVDWTKTTSPVPVPTSSAPFLEMQAAILKFQLSENITVFKDKPLNMVKYGPDTLKAASKYLK